MSKTEHVERHFTATEVVRDIVIGMSDGLTVPFALAAGLSGAVQNTHLVVIAGLAEIAAGSIAMGLGGYLAGRSDAEHYESERRREQEEVIHKREAEIAETEEIFEQFGLTKPESAPIVASLQTRNEDWVEFMMRFELGLERPDPRRALSSGITIALAYIVGGLIPLSPYMILPSNSQALVFSVVATVASLGIFGYIKGRFTGAKPLRSALQTALIGSLAAAAAYGLARVIS